MTQHGNRLLATSMPHGLLLKQFSSWSSPARKLRWLLYANVPNEPLGSELASHLRQYPIGCITPYDSAMTQAIGRAANTRSEDLPSFQL
jgi:hypothetical protein